MQRIFNVDKWVVIEPGQVLEYPSERPRQVRVEVNSSDVGNLYLINAEGEAFHLARICGRDTVEFISPGKFSLSVADNPISVYTVDGTSGHVTVEAPQSFTTIVERRRRSPEIEAMMRMMQNNVERRLAQQAEELAEQYGRRQREFDRRSAEIAAARVAKDDAAGAASGDEPAAGAAGKPKKERG